MDVEEIKALVLHWIGCRMACADERAKAHYLGRIVAAWNILTGKPMLPSDWFVVDIYEGLGIPFVIEEQEADQPITVIARGWLEAHGFTVEGNRYYHERFSREGW
jgi:hypothetical protein